MSQRPSILEIKPGGEVHLATLDARDRILRQPLGMRLSDEDTQGEVAQRHFAILEHGQMWRKLIPTHGIHR